MASAWCLYSHFRHAIPAPSLSCKEVHRLKKLNRMQVLCCESDELHNQNPGLAIQYPSGMERRQVLFRTLLAAFSFPPMGSLALADTDVLGDFRLYSDEVNKFKIMIPKDWQVGTGENNGIKSVTGFFPDEPSNSNGIYGSTAFPLLHYLISEYLKCLMDGSVTVVITGLGADFTRLESFGKVDAFAENLVGGLDRSWQRPPGVAAKLIDSKTANGLYYIEYTLKNPGESRRHLISVLGIANNGWYNRLYTVTGQFVDEDSEKYGFKVEKAVASFRFI